MNWIQILSHSLLGSQTEPECNEKNSDTHDNGEDFDSIRI